MRHFANSSLLAALGMLYLYTRPLLGHLDFHRRAIVCILWVCVLISFVMLMSRWRPSDCMRREYSALFDRIGRLYRRTSCCFLMRVLLSSGLSLSLVLNLLADLLVLIALQLHTCPNGCSRTRRCERKYGPLQGRSPITISRSTRILARSPPHAEP